jgi:hypothetical protein
VDELARARFFLQASYERGLRCDPFRRALHGDAADDFPDIVRLPPAARIVATLELVRARPSDPRMPLLVQRLWEDPRWQRPRYRSGPVAPAFLSQVLRAAVHYIHPFSTYAMAEALHLPRAIEDAIASSIAHGDLERVRALRKILRLRHDLGAFAGGYALATLALDEPDRDEQLRELVIDSGQHLASALRPMTRGHGRSAPIAADHPAIEVAFIRLRIPNHAHAAPAVLGLLRDRAPTRWLGPARTLATALAADHSTAAAATWVSVAALARAAADDETSGAALAAARAALAAQRHPLDAQQLAYAVAYRELLDDDLLVAFADRYTIPDGRRASIAHCLRDRDRALAMVSGHPVDRISFHLCGGDWASARALCDEHDREPQAHAIATAGSGLSDGDLESIIAYTAGRPDTDRPLLGARADLLEELVEQARTRARVDWAEDLARLADGLTEHDGNDERARALTAVATLLDGAARAEVVERALVESPRRIPWLPEEPRDRAFARARDRDRESSTPTPTPTVSDPDPILAAVRAGDIKIARELLEAIKDGRYRAKAVADVLETSVPAAELRDALVALAITAPKTGLTKTEVALRDGHVARAIVYANEPAHAAELSSRIAAAARQLDAARGITEALARHPRMIAVADVVSLARGSRGAFGALELYPHLSPTDRTALLAALPDPNTEEDRARALAPHIVARFRAGEPWRDLLDKARAYYQQRGFHNLVDKPAPCLPSFEAAELVDALADAGGPERAAVVLGLVSLVVPELPNDRAAYRPLVEAVARLGEGAAWAAYVGAHPGPPGDRALDAWLSYAPFVAPSAVEAAEAVRDVSQRSLAMSRRWVIALAEVLVLAGDPAAAALADLATSRAPFIA